MTPEEWQSRCDEQEEASGRITYLYDAIRNAAKHCDKLTDHDKAKLRRELAEADAKAERIRRGEII